jgi:hypothetical protein
VTENNPKQKNLEKNSVEGLIFIVSKTYYKVTVIK